MTTPERIVTTAAQREARSWNQHVSRTLTNALLAGQTPHGRLIRLSTDYRMDPLTGYTTCQVQIEPEESAPVTGSAVDKDWHTAMHYAVYTALGYQLDEEEFS